MSVARAALFPIPPPTSNALNSRQRTRLVRSTRKLGDILGATPLLTEDTQPVTVALYPASDCSSASSSRSSTPDSLKASRRQASIHCYTPDGPTVVYTSSNSMSSVVSLALTSSPKEHLTKKPSMGFKPAAKPRGSRELPRPLVLRLNAVPQPIKIPQPYLSAPPASSLTPTTGSSLVVPDTPTPTGTPVLTPTTPVFPTPTEMRRKRMAKLTRTLGEIIPPHLVPMSKKSAVSEAEPESLYSAPALPQESQATPPVTRKRRSLSVDLSGQGFPSFSRSSRAWVTGSDSWQGEWNRKDIKEVQRQLRSLKAR